MLNLPCVFLFLASGRSRGPRWAELFSPCSYGCSPHRKNGSESREACNVNTFYCLWPFMSPICFLGSKQGEITATTDLLVKGPQWPCWLGFSWVIWPASFREIRISFLHSEYVAVRLKKRRMWGRGWHRAIARSGPTSLPAILSYDIRPLSSLQIWGIPLRPPPTHPTILCP